jgi:hypothetical protein
MERGGGERHGRLRSEGSCERVADKRVNLSLFIH